MNFNLELLNQGLIAMGIGMGVVLSFLIVLIVAMVVMSSVVGYLNKIFPEVIAAPAKTKSKAATNVKDDEQIAVAIAAVLARA